MFKAVDSTAQSGSTHLEAKFLVQLPPALLFHTNLFVADAFEAHAYFSPFFDAVLPDKWFDGVWHVARRKTKTGLFDINFWLKIKLEALVVKLPPRSFDEVHLDKACAFVDLGAAHEYHELLAGTSLPWRCRKGDTSGCDASGSERRDFPGVVWLL
jgi:hypothetical protein